jgi:hypothetical protein
MDKQAVWKFVKYITVAAGAAAASYFGGPAAGQAAMEVLEALLKGIAG